MQQQKVQWYLAAGAHRDQRRAPLYGVRWLMLRLLLCVLVHLHELAAVVMLLTVLLMLMMVVLRVLWQWQGPSCVATGDSGLFLDNLWTCLRRYVFRVTWCTPGSSDFLHPCCVAALCCGFMSLYLHASPTLPP